MCYGSQWKYSQSKPLIPSQAGRIQPVVSETFLVGYKKCSAGAEGKPGHKWDGAAREISFPHKIISHKLYQLSLVKQILKKINIPYLQCEAVPVTCGFAALGDSNHQPEETDWDFSWCSQKNKKKKKNLHRKQTPTACLSHVPSFIMLGSGSALFPPNHCCAELQGHEHSAFFVLLRSTQRVSARQAEVKLG